MSNRFTTTTATLAVMLLSTSAMAADLVSQLPKSGKVTISGTIESVDNDNKLILRDSRGDTIDVHLKNNLRVSKGDHVTVNGVAESEMLGMGKQIVNANVSTDVTGEIASTAETVTDNVSDTVADTGNAMGITENAESAIDQLPDEGAVAIRGTVDSIASDKRKFTLRDNTGNTIDINSKTSMTVSKGDSVIVKGRISDEFIGMGEEIHADSVQRVALKQ